MVRCFCFHLIGDTVHLSSFALHPNFGEDQGVTCMQSCFHNSASPLVPRNSLPLSYNLNLSFHPLHPTSEQISSHHQSPSTSILRILPQDCTSLTALGIHTGPQKLVSDSSPAKPSIPKFDPKALLNPKAAAARSTTMDTNSYVNSTASPSENGMDSVDVKAGMGTLIERMHGLTKREAPLKRKSQDLEDVSEDGMQKKPKTTFNSGGSSGILGEHLKAERLKAGAQVIQSIEPIDLTNDTEDNEDDDIEIVGERSVDNTQEVCLGRLHAKANVYKIPRPPRRQEGILGGSMWPHQKVEPERDRDTRTTKINLLDKPGAGPSIKFAYIEPMVASPLCMLLDQRHISRLKIKVFLEPFPRLTGEFAGMPTSKSLNISIILRAPREKVDTIGRVLSQKNLFLTAPPSLDRGVEYVNPHAPKVFGGKPTATKRPQQASASFVTRTVEEMRRDASNIFDKLTENARDLPEMEPNTSIITTPLLSHQKQALRFMVDRESGDDDSSRAVAKVSLWEKQTTHKGNNTWFNVITGHKVDQKPEIERGGVLADVMGLGKTLSLLSLIAETREESKAFGEAEPPVDLEHVDRNAKTTLIICPKSVLSNWEEQINIHAKPKTLKYYAYHGTSRERDLDTLAKMDILLTTYNTAAAEYSDQREGRNTLKGIQFFRIVLDEGHMIRTQGTKLAQACCALSAQRRWVLTGTPVQNRLDDLGSLFKFLRIKPFNDKTSWITHILTPFKNNSEGILDKFQILVNSVTIRREKDKIGLSQRHEHLTRLGFSEEEDAIYRQFASQSNNELKLMLGRDNRLRGKSYAHVLRSLGRLRAICAHGVEMLSEDDKKVLEGMTASTAIELGDEPEDGAVDDSFISEKHAYEAYQMMKDSEVHMCAGCGNKISDEREVPETGADGSEESSEDSESEIESNDSSNTEGKDDILGYLTPCYHLICPQCRSTHIDDATPQLTEDHHHTCRYCDQYVRFGLFALRESTLTSIIETKKAAQKGKKKWDESTYSGPHTKVQALLEDLKRSAAQSAALPDDEPPIRSVVFSGWVTYLELIEHALELNGFKSVRLDGTMSLKARRAVLDAFKNDPSITILLVSIKAGGQGLNLTAASKVYMMEPQFNPGVELQAIDRVHRLGQKRDVDIVHYIMSNSVEEKILDLQDKKKKLAEMSMDKKLAKDEEAKKKIEDLRDLFK